MLLFKFTSGFFHMSSLYLESFCNDMTVEIHRYFKNIKICYWLSCSSQHMKNISIFFLSLLLRLGVVVGRVRTFQHCGPDSFPGGVRNINFYPATGVFPLNVLSCVVSNNGPHIVVITFREARPCGSVCVLVNSLLLLL